MSKKVLITGGAGFLGCHLARKLLKDNYIVTLFDIAELDAKDLLGKVIYIKGDIRDKKTLDKACKNQDYVIHAAAALPIQQSRQSIYSVNVDGTENILKVSLQNRIKKFIFISTTAVYGIPQQVPEKEDSPLEPIGYYGESKLFAEQLCKEYMKKGLPINIIRPKTFLGPERLGVFELWFEAIYTGKRVFILGDGDNPYQLLAVSDVVDAIVKTMTTKVKNQIFNIGAKKFTTWRKDLTYIINQAKSTSKITGLPVLPSQFILGLLEKANLSPIAAWHYKTMPVPSYVSIEKAEKMLGWHPKKSNQELLWENYQWYKNNRNSIKKAVGTTHRVGWNFKILNLVRFIPF